MYLVLILSPQVYVSLSGILCIVMSLVVTFGLASYCQLFYGPIHSVMPFLLLGKLFKPFNPFHTEVNKDLGITVKSANDVKSYVFLAGYICKSYSIDV